ncbi:MAG: hypothetical protein IT227_12680 [Flavobacteriales bacterium]|nr:hypothetical protein [Flavobacteriales bacterium]
MNTWLISLVRERSTAQCFLLSITTTSLSVSCSNVDDQEKTAAADVLKEWLIVKQWSNGTETLSTGKALMFGNDGILTAVGFSNDAFVSYGHFVFNNKFDSVQITLKEVREYRAGIRFHGDTLVLTSFDSKEGASRLYLVPLEFMPADSAMNQLHFEMHTYSITSDGIGIRFSGQIHNKSNHNFRNVKTHLEICGDPSLTTSMLTKKWSMYDISFPYVFSGASMPIKMTIEVPDFAKGQKYPELFGWYLVVHPTEAP